MKLKFYSMLVWGSAYFLIITTLDAGPGFWWMKYSVCMSTVNHIINDDLITFNGHPFSLALVFL